VKDIIRSILFAWAILLTVALAIVDTPWGTRKVGTWILNYEDIDRGTVDASGAQENLDRFRRRMDSAADDLDQMRIRLAQEKQQADQMKASLDRLDRAKMNAEMARIDRELAERLAGSR
jgi:hypothetical protein